MHRPDPEDLGRGITRLSERAADKDAWCRAAGELLHRAVPYDGSCWHTIDPGTLLITSHLTENLPDRFPLLAANEYLGEDVNKFADLAAAPVPVGLLSRATDGRPEASERWRGLLRPNGLDAELRVSFVDRGACWGSLILVRDRGRPEFTSEEVALVADLAGPIARGLRRAVVTAEAGGTPACPTAPGLLVLDSAGAVDSMTPAARHWLAELGGDPLPPAVTAAADAALRDGPVSSRVRTAAGDWLVLHASRLDGDSLSRSSVVIEPARPADLVALLMSAYALTPRERQVIALVLHGASSREIADELVISPYTVQEHLKSVFDKIGVRSRRELVGQVFFRHCLPDVA